ncbi:hypothetical protein [Gemmatimonas sp.]|uniref:hypothetical protein n=1 Tax=Gemmatimonas sp. TaxID=1962908 RepID=UPI003565F4A2
MNESGARLAMESFGIEKTNIARALEAMRDGGALEAAQSFNVPESRSYLSFADADGLNIVYVHYGFVDIRAAHAPDTALPSGYYEGLNRVKFPNYSSSAGRVTRDELGPLPNCAVHFSPLNPDGSCDYCQN